MAYLVQFFTLSRNLHSNRVQLVPPTHKSTKKFQKIVKIALFWTQFSRDWDRNRKIGSNGVNSIAF